MARVRSPSYPGIDLSTALKRARELYDRENRNAAAFDVVLGHWGYKPTTGPGMVVLAALKQFGLIEVSGVGEKRQVKLSGLALAILLDEVEDSPERAAAIRRAALAPKTYAMLWKKWGSPLPSEPNMRTHLIRDLKFNDQAVSGFLKCFRSTIAFAKLEECAILSGEGGVNDEDLGNPTDLFKSLFRGSMQPPEKPPAPPPVETSDWTIPLIGGKAILRLPTPLGADNFELIQAWFKSMKPALAPSPDIDAD